MTKGWRYESGRHACAARGIKTVDYFPKERGVRKIVAATAPVSMKQISGKVVVHGRSFEITGSAYAALNIATQRYIPYEIDEYTLGETLERLWLEGSEIHETKKWTKEKILTSKLNELKGKYIDGSQDLDDWVFRRVIERYPDLKHVKKDWIVIHMWNAMAEGVYNLPRDWNYRVYDYDIDIPKGSKLPKLPPKTVGLYVYQGILGKVDGLPKGKSYVQVIQDE